MAITYEPIATQTLGSATATVTFSSIPGTYTDLILIAMPSSGTGDEDLGIRFNSDTGTNYSSTILYGTGSVAGSTRGSNVNKMRIGRVSQTTPFPNIIHIQNYANTTTYKTALSRHQNEAGDGSYVMASVGLWRNTSAITTITIASETYNLQAGNTFTLYGIKAA